MWGLTIITVERIRAEPYTTEELKSISERFSRVFPDAKLLVLNKNFMPAAESAVMSAPFHEIGAIEKAHMMAFFKLYALHNCHQDLASPIELEDACKRLGRVLEDGANQAIQESVYILRAEFGEVSREDAQNYMNLTHKLELIEHLRKENGELDRLGLYIRFNKFQRDLGQADENGRDSEIERRIQEAARYKANAHSNITYLPGLHPWAEVG